MESHMESVYNVGSDHEDIFHNNSLRQAWRNLQ